MLSSFEVYITAQKNVAYQFMFLGAALITLALLFHFFGKGELSQGLRTGALICGGLILVGGLGYLNTENKLFESQKALYQEDSEKFISVETTRMAKVLKDYPAYQYVTGSIIILSVLILWFGHKAFWHGIAFSVIIFSVAFLMVEAFSHQSIKTYYEQLSG